MAKDKDRGETAPPAPAPPSPEDTALAAMADAEELRAENARLRMEVESEREVSRLLRGDIERLTGAILGGPALPESAPVSGEVVGPRPRRARYGIFCMVAGTPRQINAGDVIPDAADLDGVNPEAIVEG